MFGDEASWRALPSAISPPLKARLRVQAAINGRSMQAEARDILGRALGRAVAPPGNLAAAIRARFAPTGGIDLPEVARETMREPPTFD